MFKEIVCSGGEIALVDDEDYEFLSRFTWHYTGSPGNEYVKAWGGNPRKGSQVGYYMHKLVCGGKSPDHIGFNKLDNRKESLRIATYQQNGWNKGKPKGGRHGACTSKYKGVSKNKDTGRWHVIIKTTAKGEKPSKYLRRGPFKYEDDAARAYNEEVVKLRGEWAWVNPLPEDKINQDYTVDE